jgi:hypothetical protein
VSSNSKKTPTLITRKDEPRIVSIVDAEIEAGRIVRSRGWKGSKDVKGRKRREKAGEKEEKEAEEVGSDEEKVEGLVMAVEKSKRKFESVIAGLEDAD